MKNKVVILATVLTAILLTSCGNGARERGTIDKKPAMQEAYEMGKSV